MDKICPILQISYFEARELLIPTEMIPFVSTFSKIPFKLLSVCTQSRFFYYADHYNQRTLKRISRIVFYNHVIKSTYKNYFPNSENSIYDSDNTDTISFCVTWGSDSSPYLPLARKSDNLFFPYFPTSPYK